MLCFDIIIDRFVGTTKVNYLKQADSKIHWHQSSVAVSQLDLSTTLAQTVRSQQLLNGLRSYSAQEFMFP